MTQNTEQNVRTAREQDGQVQEMHADMVKAVCGRRSDYPEDVFRAYLKRHIVQAEARGAEEQRRKDAEGQSNVSSGETRAIYQIQHQNCVWHEYSPTEWNSADYPASRKRILYTRPANVATLEARVEQLEGICRHVIWTAKEHGLGSRGHDSALQAARAALTREGGV